MYLGVRVQFCVLGFYSCWFCVFGFRSDSSLTNAMLRPKPVVYQDQAQIQIPAGATRVPSSRVDPKLTMSDSHGRIQMQQQMLEQGYVLQAQFDQQQQQQRIAYIRTVLFSTIPANNRLRNIFRILLNYLSEQFHVIPFPALWTCQHRTIAKFHLKIYSIRVLGDGDMLLMLHVLCVCVHIRAV